jgi:hypothetical protein
MMYQEAPTTDNRLTRVELAVQRIEDKVAHLIEEFSDFKTRIECVIEDHQSTLYGDKGKPGLVGQAGTLEELRVALKGYGREPGLIADIQNLSKKMVEWDDGRKWLTRLVLGMLVTDILLHVFKIGQ